MITKPSIQWLNADSDVLLINDATVILLAMANNVSIYPTPAPGLPEIQTALNNFSTALAATATAAIRHVQKEQPAAHPHRPAAATGQLCGRGLQGGHDEPALERFPDAKARAHTHRPAAAPQNLFVSLGALTGGLDASVNPVFGASTYNWTCTAATAGAVPQTGQSTAASYSFNGLTPGVSYTIACNAVGAAGPSNWSSPVSQIAV